MKHNSIESLQHDFVKKYNRKEFEKLKQLKLSEYLIHKYDHISSIRIELLNKQLREATKKQQGDYLIKMFAAFLMSFFALLVSLVIDISSLSPFFISWIVGLQFGWIFGGSALRFFSPNKKVVRMTPEEVLLTCFEKATLDNPAHRLMKTSEIVEVMNHVSGGDHYTLQQVAKIAPRFFIKSGRKYIVIRKDPAIKLSAKKNNS